jgi:DNA mismatch repair protein MutL
LSLAKNWQRHRSSFTPHPSYMPIQRLSQSLINKIAAGEVIERPASVIKELMENAVDAGAKRIDVAAVGGGLEVMRVTDSGSGIPAAELPLAIAPHATSKLAEADDLFRVGTLGFRGEALASIGEVSRLVVRSRTASSTGGAEIEVAGGHAGEVAPCGCPVGTTVEVHNLFYNTPVRRKFMRTPQTEFGHISEAFTRIALALPKIHFTLRNNERSVFDLPESESPAERIAALFGRELADRLIFVESRDGDVRMSGCVAHPSQTRSNNRMQYLFLNGRHIRDHALQHALTEAYRGLLMVGRYAIAFLSIEMPPDLVDVNVHPTKLEVRFRDGGRLYSQLLSTLRSKFLTTDLTTQAQPPPGSEDPSGGHDETRAAQMRQELVDWAKGKVANWQQPGEAGGVNQPEQPSQLAAAPAAGAEEPWPRGELVKQFAFTQGLSAADLATERRPLELLRLGPLQPAFSPGNPQPAAAEGFLREDGPHAASETAVPRAEEQPYARPPQALQIHNRYLVTETQEGVTIIDQHALHERILFEQIRARIDAGALETQNLLVPEPVDLSPAEAAIALEHREILGHLGLRIEPFGGDTVLITGFPAMLANMNPAEILHALLERLISGGGKPDRRDLLDDMLHTVACKAAIKAGDRLTAVEIAALLEQRHTVDDSHHCPHGRPTELVFTREELDKQFKRI